jgi:hypothetical protein
MALDPQPVTLRRAYPPQSGALPAGQMRAERAYRYSSIAPSSTDFDFAPLKAFTSSPPT